jgi:hypothetical protein
VKVTGGIFSSASLPLSTSITTASGSLLTMLKLDVGVSLVWVASSEDAAITVYEALGTSHSWDDSIQN